MLHNFSHSLHKMGHSYTAMFEWTLDVEQVFEQQLADVRVTVSWWLGDWNTGSSTQETPI